MGILESGWWTEGGCSINTHTQVLWFRHCSMCCQDVCDIGGSQPLFANFGYEERRIAGQGRNDLERNHPFLCPELIPKHLVDSLAANQPVLVQVLQNQPNSWTKREPVCSLAWVTKIACAGIIYTLVFPGFRVVSSKPP